MPGTREWDEELLEHIFEPEDVEAILSTTTIVGGGADEIIWPADKKGEYSVMSGYKVYMNSFVDSTARSVVMGGVEAVMEWRVVRVGSEGSGTTRARRLVCESWQSPCDPWLKCNVDASFKQAERKWGCGMILRNSEGGLVGCRTSWKKGTPEIREGEALSFLDAMLWVE
ncbi:hypothetical protein LINPERHAP1_LOCUS36323 [Linum perenne]